MEIFISYNWSIKQQVKDLYEVLTNQLNYKVWLDDNELKSNISNSEIANAIKNSKIFISCITIDYCKCNSCNLEIEYAASQKKQIITLFIENIDSAKIDDIQIIGREQRQTCGIGHLNSCIRVNCFNNSFNWPKDNVDEIQKAINKCLEVLF